MKPATVRALTRAVKRDGLARPARRKQRNARPTLWEHGEFVAVDGEGFSDGEEFAYVVGAHHNRYVGRQHYYAYLAASDGSSRYVDHGRLGLGDCLEFLCGIVENNPLSILVAFGGSYDVCHMVAHDISRVEVARLLGTSDDGRKKVTFDAGRHTYVLEYRPRKCLTVQRWDYGARRWSEHPRTGKRVATPHLTVRLWDVIGFFQESFVGVMQKWLPDDPDYTFIQRMKGERNSFERSEIEAIKVYNAAELRCLVKIMNRVRDAINDLGLKITRWDGAGSIAAAMMTKHKVKEHKNECGGTIFEAVRRAYSGGHIEACKIGYHPGRIHHYDINSAYPDQFRRLPSLQAGLWAGGGPGDGPVPEGYTLVNVDFAFPDDLPFYPLFYRCDDGSILYPSRGRGWYWWSEYSVALRYYTECRAKADNLHSEETEVRRAWQDCRFEVRHWYHFRTTAADRPFSWVEDYYSKRQDYIRAARRGGFESGPEKIIKLGLNSLYGKTAQQVGARIDAEGELRLPPFFQLDWAGYVTAGCRAKLMEAAMQKPWAIIGFATDGLFSTEKLELETPDDKTLGGWEYKVHDGITMVMPGVYWLHDGDDLTHYSRGWDKREMRDTDFVHQAWRRRQDSCPVTIRRLIGLGSGVISAEFWKMRGCFVESTRYLRLDGDNSKRYPVDLVKSKPHLGLVDTRPRDHFLPNLLGIPESGPYPIAWLDGEIHRDLLARDMLEGEMADELEAFDAELA
jgi:DNA polymerase type B, organellar and viral